MTIDCTEYLYPVGAIDDENLLLIHQTTPDDLELWMWNTKELVAFKELSSLFLPSSVQILPSKNACSFIDRGRIKIKYFNKRTPRVIPLYEPISAISCITWISDEQFYFMGKYENNFKIFLCDISNRSSTIYSLSNMQDSCDDLYPQKINGTLFYINKNQHNEYAICKTPWTEKFLSVFFQINQKQEKKESSNFASSEKIFTFSNSEQRPCFLSMQSEEHGFFLNFTQKESEESDFFEFTCNELNKSIDGSWDIRNLFVFQLPKILLIGINPERLYESIYPLLPIYTAESIYFVSFNHLSQTCQIARYNHASKSIEQTDPYGLQPISRNSHLFAPRIINNAIYCGISSSLSILQKRSLILTDDALGTFHCQLPKLF